MNALPILLLGGAALLMMGGKKNGGLKALSGGEGDVVINGKTVGWFLEPSVGGKTQEWRWVSFDKGGVGRSMESSEGEFATEEEARNDLLKVGRAKGWKFKKSSESDRPEAPIDGGEGGAEAPWWTGPIHSAILQAEERAKQCSNPEAFLAVVIPALKKRKDEYVADKVAEQHATGVYVSGEGTQLGLAYESDLQMLVDNLFTMHCG